MKTQGFILIDVDVAALNNAGTVSRAGVENSVETKKIVKNGQTYVYVSGQAWRYWWRDTLQKSFEWKLSPVTKLEKQNVVYTEANPIVYDDDDIFGYMRASKEKVYEKDGVTVKKNDKGKDVEKDATVTRISPLKNSALISVGSVRIARNFSSMARQNDVPVLYGKEEYSAVMKGMFSIDIDQVGTFSNYNKTGFKNLNEKLKKIAKEKEGSTLIKDKYVKNKTGNPEELIRLDLKIRKKRICDTIKALKKIAGGAMQTSNLADVTPKFIILATTKSGNHPFSHIISNDPINHEQPILKSDDIKEVLKEYEKDFVGNIYIGRRGGFWNELDGELKEIDGIQISNETKVIYTTINTAIDSYCEGIEKLI
ncbi:MAG: type I-B CRISPR-associated protein Cas7/Cst2/DevR [Bacteroidales bacterium]|nr:type I-B CRISPR-associated protein Cas7/Cst2/DevR [Bacteroidales bacterium]